LWSFRARAGVNAPPSSYMVGGKQYIVVGAGGNTQVDFHRWQQHYRLLAQLSTQAIE